MSAVVANAMSIDVEDYFQVAALAPSIDRSSWSSREYRAEANTDRALELLARHEVKATFFVLGWIAEKSPGLVRRIVAAGHEVASHGQSHRDVYSQSPAEFAEETRRSKETLETISGQAVLGYRAASFSITSRSLWALDTLIELGFQYDSSVFPIVHDRYGIPGAEPHPGRLTAPSGGSIVEFPMSTASWLGRRWPVSGGGYFRILPYWLTTRGMRQVNQDQHQPFVFYMHPWEMDPEQPRVKVGLRSRLRHYTNLQLFEQRLDRLLGEFRFTTMREVLTTVGLLGTRH